MKKIALQSVLFIFVTSNAISQNKAFIEDSNFRAFLKEKYPELIEINTDSLLTDKAALLTDTLDCSYRSIYSLKGIEFFLNLQGLNFSADNFRAFPDLSKLTKLKYINCSQNYNMILRDPDISANIQLKEFDASYCNFDSLKDISNLTELEVLNISSTKILELPDLSNNKKLRVLNIRYNSIVLLPDLSQNTNLEELYLSSTNISQITHNKLLTKLKKLDIRNTLFTNIPDFSYNDSLIYLNIDGIKISSPDLSSCHNLKILEFTDAEQTTIPFLGNFPVLEELYMQRNSISSIEGLEKLSKLKILNLNQNNLKGKVELPENSSLDSLYVNNNKIDSLDGIQNLTNLKRIEASGNTLSFVSGFPVNSILKTLYLNENQLSCLNGFDNLSQLENLNLSNNKFDTLPSLHNLYKLKNLNINSNNLKSIPSLNNSLQLEVVYSEFNDLESLPELSVLTQLKELILNNNHLSEIPDLSGNLKLKKIDISYNDITSLQDFSNHKDLESFSCGENYLDYSDNREMDILYDLPKMKKLQIIPQYVFGNEQSYVVCAGDSVKISFPPQDSALFFDWSMPDEFLGRTQEPNVVIVPKLPSHNYVIRCQSYGYVKYKVTDFNTTYSVIGTHYFLSAPVFITTKEGAVLSIVNKDSLLCKNDKIIELRGNIDGGWFSGNGVTENKFYPSKIDTGFNTVTYNYKNVNGCISTSSKVFKIENCVGIAEKSVSGKLIDIYPVPCNDIMHIRLNNNQISGSLKMKVTNSLGKIVVAQNVYLTKNNEALLNIATLETGFYIIQIYTGKEIYAGEFVKSK